MSLRSRLRNGWNAFRSNRDPTVRYRDYGPGYGVHPDRVRFTRGNERTIITAILNRIAVDAASIPIMHVKLDENGRFKEEMNSDLDNCLTLEANIDQTAREFRQDVIASMLDEGCVAIVPTWTDTDPDESESTKIYEMRVGRIIEWYPKAVTVDLYNDDTGQHEEITRPKDTVAIITNPFYAVMNEPNSIQRRLANKLYQSDVVDSQAASGKLDLIIKLPYTVKSPARKEQAEFRRKQIEMQLTDSNSYGIAYVDATENITQLNRSVENNFLKQIEYYTNMLYSQLGITQSIMDGTADEKTMLNYMDRTIEPILAALCDGMKRVFLSKTARSQGQSIKYFQDPFKLVPVSEIAEIADKFTRNEIMTSNEIRQTIGMKPSSDPEADVLRNKNLSAPTGEEATPTASVEEEKKNQNETRF